MRIADSAQSFRNRLLQAADLHPECPTNGVQRIQWIWEQGQRGSAAFDHADIASWLCGEARPADPDSQRLAHIFEVDTGWLRDGE